MPIEGSPLLYDVKMRFAQFFSCQLTVKLQSIVPRP